MRPHFQEQIYKLLPVPAQNLLVSFEGSRLQSRRYSGDYNRLFTECERRQHFSQDELSSYQHSRLCQTLLSAKQSPFWGRQFAKHGVNPNASDPFGELSKLPILTKQEVKSNIHEISGRYTTSLKTHTRHTSGTTGGGLIFHETQEAEKETWATWWRYRRWHAITPDVWCGYFGGRSVVPIQVTKPPFWRINRPGKQILFSNYHLTQESVIDYLTAIRDHNLEWLHGYPSTLTLLAQYVRERKLSTKLAVRIVTTGAENLLPHQKELIQDVFQCDVRQHYGQAEGVANFSECPLGNLHVDEDFSFVEFLPLEENPGHYNIIGTNWTNRAFPLMRYEVGDHVEFDPNDSCSCGRLGRIVRAVDGRLEDYVTLPNGVKIGRLDHIFKDLVTIREAQILQSDPSEVDFLIVKGNDYVDTIHEPLLSNEIRQRLGSSIRVNIRYVPEIMKSKSGKLRFVVAGSKDCKSSDASKG